jgi:hypothetical protein
VVPINYNEIFLENFESLPKGLLLPVSKPSIKQPNNRMINEAKKHDDTAASAIEEFVDKPTFDKLVNMINIMEKLVHKKIKMK